MFGQLAPHLHQFCRFGANVVQDVCSISRFVVVSAGAMYCRYKFAMRDRYKFRAMTIFPKRENWCVQETFRVVQWQDTGL